MYNFSEAVCQIKKMRGINSTMTIDFAIVITEQVFYQFSGTLECFNVTIVFIITEIF